MSGEDIWNPVLLGHWKRDLLKEVLQVFGRPHMSWLRSLASLNLFPARSKTLAKLGMDWQEMLKRAMTSDD
jgi:protein HIRA/HIR1